MVRCITLLILLAGAVCAQESDLTRAAQNPFDLARFIDSHPHFDWSEVWKALHTERGKENGRGSGCETS